MRLRRASGARPGRERKSPAAAARSLAVLPGSGRSRREAGIRVRSAGKGKQGARRRALGRTSGRAAMNLERLRKRVRQYLDQVGGPTPGARAPGLAWGARPEPFSAGVTAVGDLVVRSSAGPRLSF